VEFISGDKAARAGFHETRNRIHTTKPLPFQTAGVFADGWFEARRHPGVAPRTRDKIKTRRLSFDKTFL